MTTISFSFRGMPKSKGRPRFVKKTGVAFNPSAEDEDHLWLAAQQHAPERLLEGPLAVFIKLTVLCPKSMKKVREKALRGEIRPTTKPDVDNSAKLVLDALNTVFYTDDSQIARLTVEKWYGEVPMTEVVVADMEEA